MSAETDKEALNQIKSSPYFHALALTESGMDPKAKNPSSTAKGLFGFIEATAKNLGIDPTDVTQSWDGVQRLTKQHIERFGDNPETLYAAHFMGAGLLSKLQRGAELSAKEREIVKDFYQNALPRFQRKFKQVTTEV